MVGGLKTFVCKAHCSPHFYSIRIDNLHEGNPVFLTVNNMFNMWDTPCLSCISLYGFCMFFCEAVDIV